MATFDWKIVDVWDNGEFLSGATAIFFVDGVESFREEHVGTTEEPPGHTGVELARSSAIAWQEAQETTLEERLMPFGPEWEREQTERRD